jgi:hypothetical protein
MATLVLDDMPNDIYEWLQQEATRHEQSLREEALFFLRCALEGGVMMRAPHDLPMPGPDVEVRARDGTPPLPEFIPSEEISAPFDLPLPDNVVRAKARQILPPLPDPID